MGMTMQGEVALQTVDTVVRAVSGLHAQSSASQGFKKVSDAVREANHARGTQSKSKPARACASLNGTAVMRAIDQASRDGALRKTDTFAVTTATHLLKILAPSGFSAMSVSMRF